MNLDRVAPRNRQRHYRNPGPLGPGEIRSGQGYGRHVRGSLHKYRDALSMQLRLCAAHIVRRRRPGRCAGDHTLSAEFRLSHSMPADRHAEDGR